MARGRGGAGEVLDLEPARRYPRPRSGPAREVPLAHRARLPGAEMLWQEMQNSPRSEQAAAETPADVAEFLHRRWLNTVPEQLTATGRQPLTEPDRVAELAAVPTPKLVLSGSSDYAWPVPWQDSMAARLTAGRTITEGADHSPNVERPFETARALIDFWQRISAEKDTSATSARHRPPVNRAA
ncbi:alpha/beta fold hydrolase [Streptomyces sp. HMX87]|uniref:alpha/beta fold hydrolase n=1 Tax=Streptomyces sp. HMX87 TaxID=3390849 RepID=UPI003A895CEE